MKESENLKLRKPDGTDFYDIEDFNYNADVIDEAIHLLELAKVSLKERECWNGKADNEIATDEKAGLFSSENLKKLKGIEANANNYTLPKASKSNVGGVTTTSEISKVTAKMTPVAIINGVPYYENTTYNLDDMINGLSEGTDTPQDADYYISQYAGGGTEHKEYYRRPMSALWSYIKSKAEKIFQEKGNYAAYIHSHPYAGSETAGGKANSAKVADSVNWNNVEGRPTRLPASDVYDWAKSPTRPAYNKSDVGLGNVDNTADANKSVNYATSAGKSSGIIDYGNTANTIQVGFGGSGASTDNLAYIAGYLTGGKQIKDVSKDVLKAWLGSMPANGGNADTLGGRAESYFATAQQVQDINSNLDNTIKKGDLYCVSKQIAFNTVADAFSGNVTYFSAKHSITDKILGIVSYTSSHPSFIIITALNWDNTNIKGAIKSTYSAAFQGNVTVILLCQKK